MASGLDQKPAIRLTNGFVFKSVFGGNVSLCKRMLEVTLGIRLNSIAFVQPERELEIGFGFRGGRVDVYVIDNKGNQFDAEIQADSGGDEALRARHYQSLMDATAMKKGCKVAEMPETVVLFICDFDPFDKGLRRYDCQTVCLQTDEVVSDRRRSVFLNAQGDKGEVSEELDRFLRFVAGKEVDDDPLIRDIKSEIDIYIAQPDWLETYMTLEEEFTAARRAARQRGREEGYRDGRDDGYKEALLQAAEENKSLVEALRDAGRIDELAEALTNDELRTSLLAEFGIGG